MTWMLQDEAADPYLKVCSMASYDSDMFREFQKNSGIGFWTVVCPK